MYSMIFNETDRHNPKLLLIVKSVHASAWLSWLHSRNRASTLPPKWLLRTLILITTHAIPMHMILCTRPEWTPIVRLSAGQSWNATQKKPSGDCAPNEVRLGMREFAGLLTLV